MCITAKGLDGTFQKFLLGWRSCRLPFEGAPQPRGATRAVERERTGRATAGTRASTRCKCVGNVARICFEGSMSVGARNWPSCLIMGPSAGGRRGAENTFHPGKVPDKSISA